MRRARISGSQAKGDQRAKVWCQARVRRTASRAPRFQHYLTGWFLIDFVSVIPYDLLASYNS